MKRLILLLLLVTPLEAHEDCLWEKIKHLEERIEKLEKNSIQLLYSSSTTKVPYSPFFQDNTFTPVVYTCVLCGKTFKWNKQSIGISCGVMHHGGCCHYLEEEVK